MRKSTELLPVRQTLRRLTGLLALVAVAMFGLPPSGKFETAKAAVADDFLVVDCLLPGKIRKLGKKVTFASARRALRTSQSDCEIRGGEYTSYDRSDYSVALQIWLPMAQEGDLKAQNYVGEIYEKGIGGTPQYQQAAEWYLKAAEKGFAAAQVNLGALYERGLGVAASPEKAAFWYRKASGLEAANIEFVPGVKQEDLQRLQRQRNDAEADRNNLRQEMEKLRKQLDDAQRKLKQQSNKSSGLQQELQKTRSQQSAVQPNAGNTADANELSAELKKQRANEARLIAEISNLEQQSAQLAGKMVSTVGAKDQELAATQQELEKLRQLLAVQQDIAQQKEERVSGLTQSLDQAREQSLALLSGKSQTEKQLAAETAALQTALAEAQRSVKESSTRSAEKEQRVAELTQQLAEREAGLKAELAKAQQQSAELQSGKAQREKQQAAEKAALEAALAEARRSAADSAAKSEEMAKNLQALEKKLAAAKTQAPVRVAEAGPVITIVDPPLMETRGAQYRSATVHSPDSHMVVGKVESPAGVMMVKVNDTEVPVDKNAMFRFSVPVEKSETQVNVVAIDTKGQRRTLTFNLIKGAAVAQVKPAAADSMVIDPKSLGVKFGDYHALVIGNSKYQFLPELKTAKKDAEEVSKMLRENYGFKVTTLYDASRYDILSTMNKMREELTEDQNLLIYYAGHGDLDQVNQRGNWLPVDAEPNSTANWISNIQVTDILNAMSARQIMLVVDSCYSGTLTRAGLARLDSGMSEATRGKWIQKMAEKRSRVVLTSGGVAPVLDGGGGGHSVFARAFLNALEANPGVLEGQRLFQMVSAEVAASSATAEFEQIPQYAPIKYAGHESGDFFLVPTRRQ